MDEKMTPKVFVNHVLAGTATGIVVGLIPNAILGIVFKALGDESTFCMNMYYLLRDMQFLVPVLVGVLIGLQFKFNGMESVLVGTAAFLASGAYKLVGDPAIVTAGGAQMIMAGIGDLVNVMLTSSIAVLVILWIGKKLGSLTIILLPIIVGGGVSAIGYYMLPYVAQITKYIGDVINTFTTMQPLIMCVLIAISFSIIIISPISTVAIGIAIGITGLGSGAANIGVTACTAVLVLSSLRVNSSGVTLGIGLGAMKIMMPNLVNHPIIAVPIMLNAVFCGVAVQMFNIIGTAKSAGFGVVGLIGPITAYSEGLKAGADKGSLVFGLIVAYLVVPIVGAIVVDILCRKVLKLYDGSAFRFMGAE